MRQMTLAHQAEFQLYSKKTRREQFLDEMDACRRSDPRVVTRDSHQSETGLSGCGAGELRRGAGSGCPILAKGADRRAADREEEVGGM
jgi:hypothetical protein